jgi:hypothetical protein
MLFSLFSTPSSTLDMDDDEIYDRDNQPDPIESFKSAAYVPLPDEAMVLAQGIGGAEFRLRHSDRRRRSVRFTAVTLPNVQRCVWTHHYIDYIDTQSLTADLCATATRWAGLFRAVFLGLQRSAR